LAQVFAKRPAQLIALIGFVAIATLLIYVFAAGQETTSFGTTDFNNAMKSNTVVNGAGGVQLATAATAGTYTWNAAGYDGGGRGNAVAIDPNNPGHAGIAGDVWGTRLTANQGALWTPNMWGLNGIGDDYGRAVAFSKKNPGVSYWGMGTLSGYTSGGYTGFFGTSQPGGLQMTKTNTTIGFASSISSGGGLTPRSVGRLIAVDYDQTSNTEYIYALTTGGLVRSTNGGTSFTTLGLTSVPNMAWKAVTVAPDGSLYVADYGTRSSDTAVTGQQEWHVTNPRGTPTITAISGLSGPVNDFATINGVVWEASAAGINKLVGSTWQPVGASFFNVSGLTISSIDGVGQTIYVGMGNAPSGDFIAKSTDGGATWKFVTGASAIKSTVLGTTRTWWLNGHGLPSSYGVEQLAVDPSNPNFVVSSGFRGAYVTQDGGNSWYPADNGLDGTEVSHVLAGTNGQAWNDDTDWAQPSGSPWHTISTTDHYTSVVGSQTSVTWPTPALSRTVGGHAYAVVKGRPYDITKDGKSIADDYYRSVMVNPTDIEISSDGYIYIGQFGGGVVVGTPH
jgi:hypothetical protein